MFSSLFSSTRRGLRHAVGVRRNFASSASAAPKQYHGVEAIFRRYLPENHQIVIFFATVEFGGIGLYFALKESKEEEVPEVVVESSLQSTEIPSIASEEFEEWSKLPGNVEKWEQSIEPWAAAM